MKRQQRKARKKKQPPPLEVLDPRPPSTEEIDRTEELLAQSISPGRIRRMLIEGRATEAGPPGVVPIVPKSVAVQCVPAVYTRWDEHSREDAPYRREKVIRIAENFYTRAVAEKAFSAAAQALNVMARMSGGFAQHDPNRERLVTQLGPVPEDPTLALLYSQKCMLFALQEVVLSSSLDPERRMRWISELGSRIAFTHSKTLVQAKLDDISSRVLGPTETNADEMEDGDSIDFPANSRLGSSGPGDGPPS